jgi:outer membrane receptor protein involved in Fe transport
MKKCWGRRWLIAVLGVGAFTSLRAETMMNLEEMFFGEIPVVYAATKMELSLSKVPNRVIVISQQDIKRRNYVYLQDIFRDLPGVQVFNNTAAEFGQEVLFRGIFQNNKIVVLWNGMKINNPDNKNYNFGRHTSLENVKSIEVVYGPASALYGADAVSAIINIVTHDYDSEKSHHGVGLAGGGDGTVMTTAKTGFKVGDIRVSAFGSFHDSKGPDLLDQYPEYFSFYKTPGYAALGGSGNFGSPNQSYDIGIRTKIGDDTDLNYLRIKNKDASSYGFNPAVFEYSKENTWAWWIHHFSLQNRRKVVDGLTLKSNVNYSHYELEPESQFINAFFNGFASFTREDYKAERSTKFEVNEELVYQKDKVTVIGGVQYQDIYSMPKLSTVTGLQANPNLPFSIQTSSNVPYAELNFDTLGAYVQGQYDFNEKWSGVAGLRWDRYWDFTPSFNPRVGVTYVPSPKANFRANYSTAILTPAPYFRYENFNNSVFPSSGSIGALPNPDLKPEKYRSVEVGGDLRPWDGMELDFTAFYNEIDNYMLHQRNVKTPFTYVPGFPNKDPFVFNPPNDGRIDAAFINANGGDIKAYGVEVGPKFKAGSRLKGWAYYSYLSGEQRENSPLLTGAPFHERLTLISHHTVKSGLEIQALKGLYVTPTLQAWSPFRVRPEHKNTTAVGGTSKGQDMPGIGLLHLSLSYDATASLRLWGVMTNVLDKAYYMPGGTGGQLDNVTTPQRRREWLAGVGYSF